MLRPTRFSNIRLCDSCSASEVPRQSGVPLERRVDVVLVEPVPALVHRGEDPAHLALGVVRGHADVRRPHRGGERMLHRVEAPAALAEPEVVEQDELHLPLLLHREVPEEARVVDLLRRQLGDQRDEALPEPGEDVAHLLGLHPRLEVVEQRVVGLVDLEARRVLAPQRDVALEVRPEELEVVRSHAPRPRPGTPRRPRASAPRGARSGTFTSLSRSRRATRIRLASSESKSSDSSYGRSSSSSSPSSSETSRSWTIFEIVPSCRGAHRAARGRHHRLLVPARERHRAWRDPRARSAGREAR